MRKKHGTSRGVKLTERVIKKAAEEAEAGYDPAKLRRHERRGRPPMGTGAATVFQVRLEPELREALDEQAKAAGTTPSEFVRRVLRRHLGT